MDTVIRDAIVDFLMKRTEVPATMFWNKIDELAPGLLVEPDERLAFLAEIGATICIQSDVPMIVLSKAGDLDCEDEMPVIDSSENI